jgi:hypothetical protein
VKWFMGFKPFKFFSSSLEDFIFDRKSIFLYFCNQPMWLLNVIFTCLILHNFAMCFSATWNFDNVTFVCSYMPESFQESWELWHSILLICMLDQLVHPIPFPHIHVDPSNSVKNRKVWFLIKTCELKTIAKCMPQVSLFLLLS